MKKPQLMLMDELLALPPFSASGVLQRARAFGGCFRDPKGMLWGTCLLDDSWSRFPGTWARFPAVQLAERTGLSEATLGEPSELWGFIDGCNGRSARGWAQDRAAPDAIIELDLSVDGRVIGQATADLFRQDLLDAGIGDGRHAFETILWTQLRHNAPQIVVAQRTGDGAVVDIAVFPLEAGYA